MAGAGGGAWKVAYADFVTAMMAFFMVMWITAQSKPVKQAVANYFNDPWKTSTKPTGDPGGGSALLPLKNPTGMTGPASIPSVNPGVAADIKRARTGQRISTKGSVLSEAKLPNKDRRKAVEAPTIFAMHDADERCVGTVLLFPEGKVELTALDKEQLTRLAAEVRGKPQKIEIRGHASRKADSQAGEPSHNAWELSYGRCLATMKFLEQQGIEPNRFRLSQGGPYEPYSIRPDPAKQAYNSRVEVYMLGKYYEELMGTPEERASRFITP